ncbi:conjugative transposon protein TraN [Paraflavitalea sp. CAU 1676]|uniref:conjugative transposon protein TraN n=1 Tax=Paraflavitalea sp. CAU 1676 TaxID=3032598 RepID=UPI0023DB42EB|nr:conjugative transposon protein TraN [Paraflavitalea sp. CAU 1676]MDF2188722.1 conjugative transposon protein TraN [Paraflavitalea sp. CAU 1676]
MKRFVLLIAIVSCLYCTDVFAQSELPGNYKAKAITPIRMDISADMTTNLIFPYPIKSVDRGSGDILAQKAKGADNVLQVKAAKEQFMQSNLSVITSDGQLFSFLVAYAPLPTFLNLSFHKDSTASPIQLAGVDLTADEIEQTALSVSSADNFLRKRTKSQMMKLKLGSIHYLQDHLWLSLGMENRSLVDYEIQYIKVYIKDRKQAKRTAMQLKELKPVYCSSLERITSDQPAKVIMAIPAFTLSRKQELRILVKEKNGGRDLELVLRNGTLLKARIL